MCVTHCGKKCKTLEIYYASAAENLCKARTQIVQGQNANSARQNANSAAENRATRTQEKRQTARNGDQPVRQWGTGDEGEGASQPEPGKMRESALNEAPFGSAGGGLSPPTK